MDSLLTRLSTEREQKATLIRNYVDEAGRQNRDLTDAEMQTISDSHERIASIDAQLATLAHDLEMADDVRGKLAALDPDNLSRGAVDHYRGNDGAYFYDLIHAADGDATAQKRLGQFRQEMERSGSHYGFDKGWTNPDDSAHDFKGLHVTPTTTLIRPRWAGAPLVEALGMQNLPGWDFKVPYLAMPTAIDAAGTATTDLRQGSGYTTTANVAANADTDPLADGTAAGYAGQASPGVAKTPVPYLVLDVGGQEVAATNYGIAFNVDRDRLLAYQPEALGILLDAARLVLARQLQRAAVAEISASTGHVALAVDADGPTTMKAITDAAVYVMETTFMAPEALVVGPKGWGMLANAADLAGRPLNGGNGSNTTGGPYNLSTFNLPDVGGLRVVLDTTITDTNMYMTNGEAIGFWGRSGDLLRTVEAVLRGETYSLGYLFAAVRPTPYANGSVRIGV